MKIFTIKDVIDSYESTHKNEILDVGKARGYFLEIVKCLGVDEKLLLRYCKNGKQVIEKSKRPISYKIPEKSVDFTLKIIQNYTSPDYKNIRRGNFHLVKTEVLESLIDGFTELLTNLGYPEEVVNSQWWRMQSQIALYRHQIEDVVKQKCDEIVKSVRDYVCGDFGLGLDDRMTFLSYAINQIERLKKRIDKVYGCYAEEIDVLLSDCGEALNDEENLDLKLDIQGQILSRLLYDQEYQELVKQKEEIFHSPEFLKAKMKAFDEVTKKMLTIQERHMQEVIRDINDSADTKKYWNIPENQNLEDIFDININELLTICGRTTPDFETYNPLQTLQAAIKAADEKDESDTHSKSIDEKEQKEIEELEADSWTV